MLTHMKDVRIRSIYHQGNSEWSLGVCAWIRRLIVGFNLSTLQFLGEDLYYVRQISVELQEKPHFVREGNMMEVRLPSVMETLFHWPTVSWAIASAFVLFWGTGLFASSKQLRKDSLIQSRLLYLRRKSAFVLRFCCEEFLYTFMALLNMAMGVVFWVLDWYHDGAPPPNANYFPVENQLAKVKEPDLRNPTMTEGKATHRPKRAGIFRPRKGYGDVCGCWGYEVEDLPASAGKFNNEVSSYKNGYVASQVLYFYSATRSINGKLYCNSYSNSKVSIFLSGFVHREVSNLWWEA